MSAGAAWADDNGIADKSAQAIADAAREAMSEVTSMRMVAKVTEESGTTALDLRFDEDGNCVGAVEPPGDVGSADIVKRGKDVWMKLDDDLLRSQVPGSAAEDAIALINGRYLHGTTSSLLLRDFAEFCDLDFFRREFASKPVKEQLDKGARTTVDGRPAITVNSRNDGRTGTYEVSTEDEPYLLRIKGTDDSGERVEASFSAFDEPVVATPPAPADSVDLSQLQ
uniref:Lipoprotein n=1 Tax=Streptomyces sp. NBC_00049 TaxID=2903617 RepID=A0AAU2JYG7_9ACTN